MLARIWSLIVKELLAVWRDPKTRAVLIIPPLIQMVVFGFAATQEVRNVDIAVVNQDMGGHATELVQRLAAARTIHRLRVFYSIAEAGDSLAARDVLAVVYIAADFSRRIDRGDPAEVGVILDGRRSNASQIFEGYLGNIVEQFQRDLPPAARVAAQPMPSPSSIQPRAWFNPNLESSWNIVPSLIAILTMLVGLVVTGLSVARERELGTFEQLLVSPATPFEIMVGKTVPALLLGVLEGTVIVVYAHVVFAVPITGSLPLLYLAMLVYMASVIGVGLFISSLVKTQQQAILGAFTYTAPAILLSGFASPIANMPDWLQTLTTADPARYLIVIIRGVFLKDMPAVEIFDNLWPMVVIAAITLTGASWLFRHRLQ